MGYTHCMEKNRQPVSDLVPGASENLMATMWKLTCEAYASDPNFDPNAPLRRDIVRMIRREDDV